MRLAVKGLSTREIAEITGWDHATIARDLQTKAVANATKTVANATPSSRTDRARNDERQQGGWCWSRSPRSRSCCGFVARVAPSVYRGGHERPADQRSRPVALPVRRRLVPRSE